MKLLLEMDSRSLLRLAGLSAVREDGGVDGVIDQDALGLDRVIYIQVDQALCVGNVVGAAAIRDFFWQPGSLAAKGLFVTTSFQP